MDTPNLPFLHHLHLHHNLLTQNHPTDYLDKANPIGDKNVKGITDTVGDQFKEGNVLGGLGSGFSNEGMDKMETEKSWTGFAQKGVEGLPGSVAPAVGGVLPGVGGSSKSAGGLVPGLGGGK